MKSITILGSTGSIGSKALAIISKFPDHFIVSGLTAYTNLEKFSWQIYQFKPKIVALKDEFTASKLEEKICTFHHKPKILYGDLGIIETIERTDSEIVLNAIVGGAGLMPTLSIIDSGKDIALANKESIVMAGSIIMDRVEKRGVKLLPVDSEHSAIFQCLLGSNKDSISEILLTASGGPFFYTPKEKFKAITSRIALKHPNWEMGRKISIDSATLMNKSLEIIEAKYLFDVSINKIKVIIHPESIIHSMVSFNDGVVLGQMGIPDMISSIAYAFSYPERLDTYNSSPNFVDVSRLSFKDPNLEKFPCLLLGSKALKYGGAMPAVMNASNEIAVKSFLKNEILFSSIYYLIKDCMNLYKSKRTSSIVSISNILKADKWARKTSINLINLYKKSRY